MQSQDTPSNDNINEGRWLPEEHLLFLRGLMQYGKDWKNIQGIVKTRMASQVRSHSQKFFGKLIRIGKDRKKGKNKELNQPTDIQRQILIHFNEAEITPNTPPQLSNLLKMYWPQQWQNNENKQRIILPENKQKEKTSEKIGQSSRKDAAQFLQNYPNSQDSFFMRIFHATLSAKKQNIEGVSMNQQFSNMVIDTGIFNLYGKQQYEGDRMQEGGINGDEDHILVQPPERERKQSFILPDEEDNDDKLQQILINIRKQMGYN